LSNAFPAEFLEGAEPLARELWAKAAAVDPTQREAYLVVSDKFIEAVQIGWIEGVRAVLALATVGVGEFNQRAGK
jgi:hypothetical protein